MVGKTLSHYKVLEKIGQEGMGEVYRAEDTNRSPEVAIKVLPEQFSPKTPSGGHVLSGKGRRHLSKLLESYEAKHFVVGHTPQLLGKATVPCFQLHPR
jgi:serine/threonine protein kinase